ncbi:MAG: hypothetical protein EBU49_03480 [Proteobacteria bacterium]|nr:hypothetical protein [Pseudomonadota bacterium]
MGFNQLFGNVAGASRGINGSKKFIAPDCVTGRVNEGLKQPKQKGTLAHGDPALSAVHLALAVPDWGKGLALQFVSWPAIHLTRKLVSVMGKFHHP